MGCRESTLSTTELDGGGHQQHPPPSHLPSTSSAAAAAPPPVHQEGLLPAAEQQTDREPPQSLHSNAESVGIAAGIAEDSEGNSNPSPPAATGTGRALPVQALPVPVPAEQADRQSLLYSNAGAAVIAEDSEENNLLQGIIAYFTPKFDSIATELKELSKFPGAVAALNDEFSGFKDDINDRVFRDQLKWEYGNSFSRPFVVQGLSGAVRLVTGANCSYSPRKLDLAILEDSKSDIQRQQSGIDRLVDFIYSRKELKLREHHYLDEFRETLAIGSIIFADPDNISNEDKNELFEISRLSDRPITKLLCDFSLASKPDKDFRIRKDNPLGILLLSAAAGMEPLHEIDIDCRGSVDMIRTPAGLSVCNMSLAEIKSSRTSIRDAAMQLQCRLDLLEVALRNINPSEDITVYKTGIIVLPKSERRSAESTGQYNFHLELKFV